jgi:DNA (cytosine-5)-methyltransferase 1
MNCLDLFTGIGGFSIALAGVCNPVAYCDIDPSVQMCISNLISKGVLRDAPIVKDVADLAAFKQVVGNTRIDAISAGFPCLGFSTMGLHEGLKHDGSALFFAVVKLVKLYKPKLLVLENVAAILSVTHTLSLTKIVDSITKAGYDMRWTVCSASSVGAPHERKRWFCLCTRRGARIPAITVTRMLTPKQ